MKDERIYGKNHKWPYLKISLKNPHSSSRESPLLQLASSPAQEIPSAAKDASPLKGSPPAEMSKETAEFLLSCNQQLLPERILSSSSRLLLASLTYRRRSSLLLNKLLYMSFPSPNSLLSSSAPLPAPKYPLSQSSLFFFFHSLKSLPVLFLTPLSG